ncbi:MAG: HlyD family efflux transporter periplasmic adaptor subunit [Paludibacteraceae bacterium]|jgi:HlyD family secretion protein|nr:HlyD family efflux transporter periplasmic adaptor subunit [Paludibacteraceae bacterium]MBP8628409.1 HlyD family efflux transporter periplasmic adaptor subunit [Paludibacteraceae bacterium]MBP9648846.1 HlyD family efflux transporter periplasmic adaptor subunit [Paludibacteraceae bacterium]HNZ84810.1 HlyD family efflux transporter periplasmic adaptor subunit [Paludibacteraceae bacterium]
MKTKNKKQAIFLRNSCRIGLLATIVSIFLVSCSNSDGDVDASGTFETTEIIVSTESMGKIMQLNVEEGQQLNFNQRVGYIDTTQLYLKKLQLVASKKALQSRRPDIQKQIAALEQQIETAKTERKRVENLVKAEASTTKQLDDANAQIKVLEKQLEATKSSLENTSNSILGDNEALQIQIEQIEDQLQKCYITSPISGVVLTKYAEQGELATPGKALFKIGDVTNMILRAYVTSDQLTQIALGQKVKVYADYGEDRKEYEGVVSWISSKSEFTPKTIQTRDERANLVYAVKINIKNDGLLKIGMYGNVKFN